MTGVLQAVPARDAVPDLVWIGIAVVGFLLFLSIWTAKEQEVSWKFGATAALAAGLLGAIGVALALAPDGVG